MIPEHGRILDSKHTLDHIFFGLSHQVATSVDYLTRKLLEKAFEALMDAGKLVNCGEGLDDDDVRSR